MAAVTNRHIRRKTLNSHMPMVQTLNNNHNISLPSLPSRFVLEIKIQ